jgi:2-keto-4-pentenoate hydratase/2-oxohepta-3-ene-1,7-dioic acid hydratase in catechol pathway
VIATAFDPAVATLRTIDGGRERQNYALSDMFFPLTVLVSRLSHDMRLEAGDVILRGTLHGVLPMKLGTSVDLVVEGIGTLANVYG